MLLGHPGWSWVLLGAPGCLLGPMSSLGKLGVQPRLVLQSHICVSNLSSIQGQFQKIGSAFNPGLCVQSARFGSQSEFIPSSILESCEFDPGLCVHSVRFCIQSELNPGSIPERCEFNPGLRVQSTRFCVQSEFNQSSILESCEFNLGLCVQSARFCFQSEFNPSSL